MGEPGFLTVVKLKPLLSSRFPAFGRHLPVSGGRFPAFGRGGKYFPSLQSPWGARGIFLPPQACISPKLPPFPRMQFLDLTSHVRLRLTGPDRVRYLNGQVTNDVRKAAADAVLWAGVTNHKGKLEALVSIHAGLDGALEVDGPASLREFLPLRLEKYLIADDAVFEDISEQTTQFHFLDEGTELALPAGVGKLACRRLGVPGWDVWGPSGFCPAGTELSHAAAEMLRIDHGIPSWENELARDILPPEAGLETWAVDYHKGCYIGQEVISRLKSVGKVNKLLVRLVNGSGPAPEAGWEIFPAEPGTTKPCGHITSSIYHPGLEKVVALGYVRREHSAAGTPLLTGPDAHSLFSRIEIRTPNCPLPTAHYPPGL